MHKLHDYFPYHSRQIVTRYEPLTILLMFGLRINFLHQTFLYVTPLLLHLWWCFLCWKGSSDPIKIWWKYFTSKRSSLGNKVRSVKFLHKWWWSKVSFRWLKLQTGAFKINCWAYFKTIHVLKYENHYGP